MKYIYNLDNNGYYNPAKVKVNVNLNSASS